MCVFKIDCRNIQWRNKTNFSVSIFILIDKKLHAISIQQIGKVMTLC